MNKKLSYIPFICIIAIFIVLLIIGTFNDLEIAKAFYIGRNNGFGIFFASIGVGLPFLLYCLYGGYLFSDALFNQNKVVIKIVSIILAIGMSLTGWVVSANEFCSVNAYDIENKWIVFLCTLPLLILLFYIGFIKGKENNNKYYWLVIILLFVLMLVSYEGIVNLLKNIMHRPRYRELVDGELTIDMFHKFYEPCKNYKDYINLGISKEEFKSFPSGHACNSCLMIMLLAYLPIVFPKLNNKRTILFFVGLAYTLLISLTRMLVGAHFLTDVSIGFLSAFICSFILNIIIENKILKIKE